MRFPPAAVTAALLLTLVTSGHSASARPVQVDRELSPAQVLAQAAHTETNLARTVRGLGRLDKARCLKRMANRQAERMAERKEMFHQDLGPVLRRCELSTTGKNVAYGYSSGAAVVAAWMASEGHRANILKREYRLMGIGAAKADNGTWYVAQVFGRKA